MKNIPTFEDFINEAKEYTFSIQYNTDEDDVEYIQNVLMDAGVDAIAEPAVHDSEQMVIKTLNAIELRKAKKAIEADGFEIRESTINEKIEYPEGVKTTNDKILDKVAKLLNSSKGTIEIGSGSVRGKKIPFMTGDEYFNITNNGEYYVLLCKKGEFEIPTKDIKNAQELYDQIEKAIQIGQVTIGKQRK